MGLSLSAYNFQAEEEMLGKEKPEEKKTKSEMPKQDKEKPMAEQKQPAKPDEEKKNIDSDTLAAPLNF